MNMSSGYDRTATLMNSQWVGCRHKIKAISIPARSGKQEVRKTSLTSCEHLLVSGKGRFNLLYVCGSWRVSHTSVKQYNLEPMHYLI